MGLAPTPGLASGLGLALPAGLPPVDGLAKGLANGFGLDSGEGLPNRAGLGLANGLAPTEGLLFGLGLAPGDETGLPPMPQMPTRTSLRMFMSTSLATCLSGF